MASAAPHRRPRPWLWIAATVVAAAAIFIMVARQDSRTAPPVETSGIPQSTSPAGEPVLGAPQARVTVDEFGDFQCPYCGEFVRQTEPKIIAKYVATGRVKIVWHTLAFIGPESALAGRAAWCAQQRGKFWLYFATLYRHQGGENTGTFNTPRLERWAVDLGMERGAFGDCLAGTPSIQGLEAGTRAAQAAGVTATPGFIVNGRKATGVLTFSQLSMMIEKALRGSP